MACHAVRSCKGVWAARSPPASQGRGPKSRPNRRPAGLGGQLDTFFCAVDFEVLCPELEKALACADGSKGGLPPFDREMEGDRCSRQCGVRLREGPFDRSNTAPDVWADMTYRSKTCETFMEKHGLVPRARRKKPHLKPTARHIQRPSAATSVLRSCVEHVFADQKSQMGLLVRIVGAARATMRSGWSTSPTTCTAFCSWGGSALPPSSPEHRVSCSAPDVEQISSPRTINAGPLTSNRDVTASVNGSSIPAYVWRRGVGCRPKAPAALLRLSRGDD
jgi:hypothetical protein